MRLVNLLALDSDVARILGLLWVDRTAPVGVSFDYKVIGYWSGGSTTTVQPCTDVTTTEPGTTVGVGTTLTLAPRYVPVPMPMPMPKPRRTRCRFAAGRPVASLVPTVGKW